MMTTISAFFFTIPAVVWSLSLKKQEGELNMARSCSLRQDAMSEIHGSREGACERSESKLLANQGVAYMSFVGDKTKGNSTDSQTTVWVSGYPRSGSSTILSMVSATTDNNRLPSQTFSLFEPCHDGDKYEDWKAKLGCESLLWSLARCDFSGVQDLWGWADPHSTNNFTKFSANLAQDMCSKSETVAFKTVDYGHELAQWVWLLDSRPKMKVLDVVRDPRGIFASWRALEPFATLLQKGVFYKLTEVCDHFAANLDLKDDRVHRVIFEELMLNPAKVTKEVYDFLGRPYGAAQDSWIEGTFNRKECPPPPPGMEGFTDCHVNSGASVDKWRDVLTDHDKLVFKNTASCQRVVQAYGYPAE